MKRAFWWVRLHAKRAMVTLGVGDRLIEFCHRCGRHQPLVWWADDLLWNLVATDGILCPECFDRLAKQRFDVLLRWVPYPHIPI